MSDYVKVVAFIFDLCGNEFTTQLILIALLYISVFKKRSLFYVRYPLCFAVIIGLQYLQRFGLLPMPVPLNYILIVAMLTATMLICYKTNIIQAMFASVCIYGGQHIISNISYVFIFSIMKLAGKMDLYVYYYVVMPLIMAAGMAVTYIFPVRAIMRKGELKFNNLIIYYFAVAFVLVASTLTHYGRNAIFWSLEGVIYLLVISTLFTCSTMLVGFMNLSKKELEEENAILQEILHKDEQRYEQAKLSGEKIQIKYHDMKQRMHHGIVDYESLKEVESDSEIIKSTYFTGNNALDVILSEKALMCERLGIRFICTADGAAIDFMKPHHIYSFVGNALENAVESLKDETDESLREITVSITRRENTCIIKTVNYVKHRVKILDGMPVTIKSDMENHGFGAKSMKSVVLKYGGHISFYEEDSNFIMIAMIPIPQKQ